MNSALGSHLHLPQLKLYRMSPEHDALGTHRQFTYDVAFSLLIRDANIAGSLADQLAPLACFVFTQRQRELVGRNGVEAFAELFRRDARLAVVLYRAGYGETDYTDLEARGIQDRGLETRWRSPILINLDGSSPPSWFPSQNIWLDLQRYPLSEAAGAIRLRAEELGASRRVETAAESLHRLSRRKEDAAARQQHARSASAVKEVEAEVKDMISEMRRTMEENEAVLRTVNPFLEATDNGIAIATRSGSLVVTWQLSYTDSLDDAGLYVKLFDGYIPLGDRRPARKPQTLSDFAYKPVLDDQWTWRWHPDNRSEPLTTTALRDDTLKRLFAIIFKHPSC